MYPKTDAMPAQEEVIKVCGCVFDAIYNPGRTRLLEVAQRHGIPTVGGMSMLVWQAVAAHEIWDGDRYDPGDIQKLTEECPNLSRCSLAAENKGLWPKERNHVPQYCLMWIYGQQEDHHR